MKTAVKQNELQALGQFLQERLLAELSHYVPIQIQCVLKKGTLMVLAQHPAEVAPDQQQTFATLQQAILTQAIELTQQVRLYLRVTGQKQPYSFHTFTFKPQPWSPPTESNVRLDSIAQSPASLNSITELAQLATDDQEPEPREPATLLEPQQPISEVNPEIVTLPDASSETVITEEDPAEISQDSFVVTPAIAVLAGASLGFLITLGLIYLFNRPCVVGKCNAIDTAQVLSQESAKTIELDKSQEGLVKATQQLAVATAMLRPIPFWSSYYSSAQKLLATDQTQLTTLEQLVTAGRLVGAAVQAGENVPHSLQMWSDLQILWQEAIDKLEKIPSSNNLYPLAQQKLQEYRINLKTVNSRLRAEEQSQKQLSLAQSTAHGAEAAQGIAVSRENWQSVESTWQKAVDLLKAIPPGTMGFTEAQELLTPYQAKLIKARDRHNQEKLAITNYTQSVNFAFLAKNWEQDNQWNKAIANWNRALIYAQQIPSETFYYHQAQQLIVSYTDALKQAENSLKWANILQQTNHDLSQICSGSPTICSFIASRDKIKVRITSDYKETISTLGATDDIKTRAGIIEHLRSLEDALETISDNAQLPLETYAPDGYLIGTHEPKN